MTDHAASRDLATALRDVVARAPGLALATYDPSAWLAVNYVPFAVAGGRFVIVRSALARQTAQLEAASDASLLVVAEDGDDAYARSRLSATVRITRHPAGSPGAARVWSALERRHGETVALLAGLPDFAAYDVEPIVGRLFLGFASAHDVDAATFAAALAS